jgi:hypothetical protein
MGQLVVIKSNNKLDDRLIFLCLYGVGYPRKRN